MPNQRQFYSYELCFLKFFPKWVYWSHQHSLLHGISLGLVRLVVLILQKPTIKMIGSSSIEVPCLWRHTISPHRCALINLPSSVGCKSLLYYSFYTVLPGGHWLKGGIIEGTCDAYYAIYKLNIPFILSSLCNIEPFHPIGYHTYAHSRTRKVDFWCSLCNFCVRCFRFP